MKKQAEHFGAEYVHGSVLEADLSKRPFRLNIDGEWLETRTLIVASGASARWLNLPSEQKLIGHGVSSCATCDGLLLSRQEDHGDRRRRLRDGGSELPHALRLGGHARAPSRRIPRVEDHARPCARESEDQVWITNTAVDEIYDVCAGHRHRREAAQPENGRDLGARRGRLLRRDRPHPEHQAVRRASSISTRTATSFRTAARGRISPACSTRATCRTAPTGRRSPHPARAAWLRSRPNASSKPKVTESFRAAAASPMLAASPQRSLAIPVHRVDL